MRHVLPRFLLVTTLFGCSDSEPATQDVDLSTFGETLAEVHCDTIFTCCTLDEVDTVFTGVDVETVEQCQSTVQGYTRVFLVPAVEASAKAGRVRIDTTKEPGCREALQARECSAFTPSVTVDVFEIEACAAFIQPVLKLSEFCHEDFECKTGFCSLASGADEGSCKARPAEGEPCLNAVCGAGLYCTSNDSCQARLAADESCTRNEECLSDNCVEGADAMRVCGESPIFCEGG